MTNPEESIASFPQEQRRVILVASKEKQQELIPMLPDLDWWKWALIIGAGVVNPGVVVALGLGQAGLSALIAAWRLYHSAANSKGDDGVELLSFWKEVLASGELPFPAIEPAEAQRAFRFDVGQYPVDGSLYMQHFMEPEYYLLPSDYNPRLARQKAAVFKMIAADLGARRVEIVSAQTMERNWFGKPKIPIPEAAVQIGIEASFDSAGLIKRSTVAEFDRPKTEPRVLPKHQRWVSEYPDLAAMVHGRLEQRMRRDKVSLEMKDTCSIGAKVVADLAGKGVELGGRYQSVAHSLWHYEIEYWPVS